MKCNYIFTIGSILFFACLFTLSSGAQEKEKQIEIIRLSDRAWLGVQISDVSPDIIDIEKLPRDEGAFVTRVSGDSPADSAGIRAGDVIIRFGDREIYEAEGLRRAVRRAEINETVPVLIVRDGGQQELSVTLRERPRRQAIRIPRIPDTPRIMMHHRHGRLGISVIDLNPQLREYFQVREELGVLVERVFENSPAEKANLRAGDVILRIDENEIASARELRRTLAGYEADEQVRIEIMREGSRSTITAQLEEREISEFYLPDFDREEFEIQIFGPGGAEAFRRSIEESIRPGMEEFKIQMEEFRKRMEELKHDIDIEIPNYYREVSNTNRI